MKTNDAEILRTAQDIQKTVVIPAQPQTVMELVKLTNAQNVNVNQIIKVLGKDPALTAKMLKIANSPLFGLGRPVDSIGHALNVMGFRTFQRAVLASALKDIYAHNPSAIRDTFWNHSEIAACCCEIIAKHLKPELMQPAYLTGLFHDCAIPVLLSRFDDYDGLVVKALHYRPDVIPEEDQRYRTNHCVIGYLFARSWQLPESVRTAILRHHDEEPEYGDPAEARLLSAILRVAEFIIQDYDTSGNAKTLDPLRWAVLHEKTMDVLGIEPENIVEFEGALLEAMNHTV